MVSDGASVTCHEEVGVVLPENCRILWTGLLYHLHHQVATGRRNILSWPYCVRTVICQAIVNIATTCSVLFRGDGEGFHISVYTIQGQRKWSGFDWTNNNACSMLSIPWGIQGLCEL